MSTIEVEELIAPLLPLPQHEANESSGFGLFSNVTFTVPFWFVLVVCFAVLMMVMLGFGFLYAVVLAQPAVITISQVLTHTDGVVKSMVASSAAAIANGNELVRSVKFDCDDMFDCNFALYSQALESRLRCHQNPAIATRQFCEFAQCHQRCNVCTELHSITKSKCFFLKNVLVHTCLQLHTPAGSVSSVTHRLLSKASTCWL